jgi:hypothetical protein
MFYLLSSCMLITIFYSFERLVEFLREKATISRTKACLERFHRLSNLFHKATKAAGEEPERVNVRIFLAVYMIVVYPRDVFENMGDLERRLLGSAKVLLEMFEKILHSDVLFHQVSKMISQNPHMLSELFSQNDPPKSPHTLGALLPE